MIAIIASMDADPLDRDALPPPGTRVIVGMSGGVDSSVTALLLVRAGLDVSGVFMRNWEDDDDACTARQDYRDAAGVAARLGIELEHVSFAEAYWEGVFEHFLAEYRAGRTPNPDVLCNREIKFKAFLDHAVARGAELIATGHYVRGGAIGTVDAAGDAVGGTGAAAAPALLRGLDPNKDQSYFLYQLGRRALARSVFPIGALDKPVVRALAREAGFHLHAKRDSTGICFIGERKFSAFLADYLPASPGEIVTDAGDVVGRHSGLMFHTYGQRQGLGIGGRADADASPWYVVGKDLAGNRLVVGQGHEHPMLMHDGLTASELHWVAGRPPAREFRCTARVRYRQDDVPVTIRVTDPGAPGATSDGAPVPGMRVEARFDAPLRAITPGQSLVLYDGERCLGGRRHRRVRRVPRPCRSRLRCRWAGGIVILEPMSELATIENQTVALAGVFQAVHLCKSLATTGRADEDDLAATLRSILTLESDRVIDAYGGSPAALRRGLRVLKNQMSGRGAAHDMDLARYALSLMQLGTNVLRDDGAVEQLRIGIGRARSLDFEVADPTMISNFANLYRSAISHLSPRIMVSGDPAHLNDAATASTIRAVLLGGLRSVVLWQQCGGARWRLLLSRPQYVAHAGELLRG